MAHIEPVDVQKKLIEGVKNLPSGICERSYIPVTKTRKNDDASHLHESWDNPTCEDKSRAFRGACSISETSKHL